MGKGYMGFFSYYSYNFQLFENLKITLLVYLSKQKAMLATLKERMR